MGLGDRAHDRQPEPGAVVASAAVGAREALPRAGEECRGEARPVVDDVELDDPGPRAGAELDVSAGVAERVGDEVVERLRDARRIDDHPQLGRRVDGDLRPGAAREVAAAPGGPLEQLGDRPGAALEDEPVVVGAGEQQEVVGEAR